MQRVPGRSMQRTIALFVFSEKPAERAKPIRHEEPRQEPGKFEGAGTYAGLSLP